MIFTFSAHFPFRGRKMPGTLQKPLPNAAALGTMGSGEQVLRPDETTAAHRRLYRKGGAHDGRTALYRRAAKIAAEQGLTVLHAANDYATREIRTADVNRPGLQLAGFTTTSTPSGCRSSAASRARISRR